MIALLPLVMEDGKDVTGHTRCFDERHFDSGCSTVKFLADRSDLHARPARETAMVLSQFGKHGTIEKMYRTANLFSVSMLAISIAYCFVLA